VAERATIARPYARAAFEYAREHGAIGQWSTGLARAAAIVADPRVAALINSPRWAGANLVALITDVAGTAIEGGLHNFLRLLAQNKRLLLLGEIAHHYSDLRASAENTIEVEVLAAAALSDAQRERLAAALGARLRRAVHVHHSVSPALLGGAIVRAGDLVLDGSLRGRLQRLTTELTN